MANHFLLYSFIVILFFRKPFKRFLMESFNLPIFVSIFIFFSLILGSILNSYVSTFYLSNSRVPIFFVLLFGALPLTFLVQAFHADERFAFLKGNICKLFFLISLIFPMLLNFNNLFLLGYTIILLIAFWLVFGFLAHNLFRRVGYFLSIALANGVTLAWTMATAIPTYLPWITSLLAL